MSSETFFCCNSETPIPFAPSETQKGIFGWPQKYRCKPDLCRARTTTEGTGFLSTAQRGGNLSLRESKTSTKDAQTNVGLRPPEPYMASEAPLLSKQRAVLFYTLFLSQAGAPSQKTVVTAGLPLLHPPSKPRPRIRTTGPPLPALGSTVFGPGLLCFLLLMSNLAYALLFLSSCNISALLLPSVGCFFSTGTAPLRHDFPLLRSLFLPCPFLFGLVFCSPVSNSACALSLLTSCTTSALLLLYSAVFFRLPL